MNSQRMYAGRSLKFSTLIENEYNSYFEKAILQFREDNLENENEEFANILKEYRDGLLLFDLMEKEVWNKASKDSLGIEKYYDEHKSEYQWKDRVEVVMASSADESIAKKALKENLTLKQAAIKLKIISEKDFDKIVDAKKMI